MLINSMFIYFSFILIIILTIILKKKPVLIGALGLFTVGIAESKSFFNGIQIAFRSILLTASDLLPIILLIGLVVGMSTMLKETGADEVIIKPLLKLKSFFMIYWLTGLLLVILTLFLWPTPAVTLLGALVLPLINNSKMNPLGLAVGLCIFGEGIGLAGDFVIQGAPGLIARSAGLEIDVVIMRSMPLVLGSGLIASVIGYWQLRWLNRKHSSDLSKMEVIQDLSTQNSVALNNVEQESLTVRKISDKKRLVLAGVFVLLFILSIAYLLLSGIRGDGAAAITGGITILIIIIGALLSDFKNSLNSFVLSIQNGMKFSMGVFAPIIVIAAFFSLGTRSGSETVLLRSGPGFLELLAIYLSDYITLNIYSSALIIVFSAILGAMSGSGFSALPLVGGISAALGLAGGLPVVPLAVLGQTAAIWTDAMVIPWGFPAVVSAITRTEAVRLVRHGVLPWISALIFLYVYTVLTFN